MASPSSVLTRGLGSWGSVNLLPTLGYGIATPVVIKSGPAIIAALGAYQMGPRATGTYQSGPVALGTYVPGAAAIAGI